VGFGKTNLLSEWARYKEIQQRIAWLTLDEEDDSPTRFWGYVIAAIQSVLEGVGDISTAYLRSPGTPTIEAILTPLLNELADGTEQVVLVLDNYHLISRDEIQKGIAFLIEHQPEQIHLAISTRADPPLPIVRIRAQGQLTELRGDDLRFTQAEVRGYLNEQLKLGLTESEITDLDARIGGWIAGLELAATSIRDRVDRQEFITAFTSSHSFILE
jgi:LuxR family maltose regulon positive regulatory protein